MKGQDEIASLLQKLDLREKELLHSATTSPKVTRGINQLNQLRTFYLKRISHFEKLLQMIEIEIELKESLLEQHEMFNSFQSWSDNSEVTPDRVRKKRAVQRKSLVRLQYESNNILPTTFNSQQFSDDFVFTDPFSHC